jgi:hypothetical protein
MAVNKSVGDNARKGAVKKRTQIKTKLGGATAFTKRNKTNGEFMGHQEAGKEEKSREKIQRGAAGTLMGRFFIGVTIVSIGILPALYLRIVIL